MISYKPQSGGVVKCPHRVATESPECKGSSGGEGMRKSFLGLFVRLLGCLEERGDVHVGRCPLCGVKGAVLVNPDGRWRCSGCKEKGDILSLVHRLHPGMEAKHLKTFGIEVNEADSLREKVVRVSDWVEKRGKVSRSEVMQSLHLEAWQMDRIEETLIKEGVLKVEKQQGQRGPMGKVWVWRSEEFG